MKLTEHKEKTSTAIARTMPAISHKTAATFLSHRVKFDPQSLTGQSLGAGERGKKTKLKRSTD